MRWRGGCPRVSRVGRAHRVGGQAWHSSPALLGLRVHHADLRMLVREGSILLATPRGFRVVRGVVGWNLWGCYNRGSSILTFIPCQGT